MVDFTRSRNIKIESWMVSVSYGTNRNTHKKMREDRFHLIDMGYATPTYETREGLVISTFIE